MFLHWNCTGKYFETFGNYYFTYSGSLIDLLGRGSITGHSECEPLISELSHRSDVFASIQRLLAGDKLVPVHGDGGAALPPVSCRLLKRLTQPGQSSVRTRSGEFTYISDLNLSCMLFMVVLVIMVQSPELSVMVITGVEAMAAFRNMKPTLSTFRKSS